MSNYGKISFFQKIKNYLKVNQSWIFLIFGLICNLFPHIAFTIGCLNSKLDQFGKYTCTGDSMQVPMMIYAIVFFIPNFSGIIVCCIFNAKFVLKNYKKIKPSLGLVYLAYFISVPLVFFEGISKFFANLVN